MTGLEPAAPPVRKRSTEALYIERYCCSLPSNPLRLELQAQLTSKGCLLATCRAAFDPSVYLPYFPSVSHLRTRPVLCGDYPATLAGGLAPPISWVTAKRTTNCPTRASVDYKLDRAPPSGFEPLTCSRTCPHYGRGGKGSAGFEHRVNLWRGVLPS